MYTPYLSHSDPTVERRTGFLIPTYGSDTDLGQFISTPYYINIAPNMGRDGHANRHHRRRGRWRRGVTQPFAKHCVYDRRQSHL